MFKVNFGENDSENPIEEVSQESSVTEEETVVSEINPLLTDTSEVEAPRAQPEVTVETPGSESETEPASETDSEAESDLDEDNNDDKDESKDESNFF